MNFSTLVLGAPNRLTVIAYADLTFRPLRSFQEPTCIRYLARTRATDTVLTTGRMRDDCTPRPTTCNMSTTPSRPSVKVSWTRCSATT